GASGRTDGGRWPGAKTAGARPNATAVTVQNTAPAASVGLPRLANAPTMSASTTNSTGRIGVTRTSGATHTRAASAPYQGPYRMAIGSVAIRPGHNRATAAAGMRWSAVPGGP